MLLELAPVLSKGPGMRFWACFRAKGLLRDASTHLVSCRRVPLDVVVAVESALSPESSPADVLLDSGANPLRPRTRPGRPRGGGDRPLEGHLATRRPAPGPERRPKAARARRARRMPPFSLGFSSPPSWRNRPAFFRADHNQAREQLCIRMAPWSVVGRRTGVLWKTGWGVWTTRPEPVDRGDYVKQRRVEVGISGAPR